MLLVFIYPTLYTTQLGSGKIQWLLLAQNTPDLHSSIHAFPIREMLSFKDVVLLKKKSLNIALKNIILIQMK